LARIDGPEAALRMIGVIKWAALIKPLIICATTRVNQWPVDIPVPELV
jgi:hypothetical protein